jgi:hypothetical protein
MMLPEWMRKRPLTVLTILQVLTLLVIAVSIVLYTLSMYHERYLNAAFEAGCLVINLFVFFRECEMRKRL